MSNGADIQILYIGLHPGTLLHIDKPPFQIVAISYLDFLARISFNPANNLFALAYTLHVRGISRVLSLVTYFLWKSISLTSTGYRKRYAAYLSYIITNNIRVVDADNPDELKKTIMSREVSLIVVNGWSLLKKEILQLPPLGVVNVHPSNLPLYRGSLPTLWALKHKDTTAAVSLMLLKPGMDDGPLLSQREFPLTEDSDSLSVEATVDSILSDNLFKDLKAYITGDIQPFYQSGVPSFTAKYEAYRRINWKEETADEICNKVLLYPHLEPGVRSYSCTDTRRIYFNTVRKGPTLRGLAPGSFKMKGVTLCIQTREHSIMATLIKDISPIDSFRLLASKERFSDKPC